MKTIIFLIDLGSRDLDENVKTSDQSNAQINETMMSYAHPELPFGGIRRSGKGVQRGYYGFCDLSFKRSFYRHYTMPFQLEIVPHMYAPYDRWKSTIRFLMEFLKRFRATRSKLYRLTPALIIALIAYKGFMGAK